MLQVRKRDHDLALIVSPPAGEVYEREQPVPPDPRVDALAGQLAVIQQQLSDLSDAGVSEDSIQGMLDGVKHEPAGIFGSPDRWIFDVERGASNEIKRIVATRSGK